MPNLRFAAPMEQRVALVTGGAKGMGRACAIRLAEAGRDVAVVDVLEELAEVITFLCSEANTYVSGGIVPIKGGGR